MLSSTQMSFTDYAKPHIKTIETLLFSYLGQWQRDLEKNLPKISDMTDLFVKANKGGGRLRGVLIILGHQTSGGRNVKEAAKAALAIELFQTAILAQDDFMDKSELRRGIPALYRAISVWHKKNRMIGDSLHFGASQAISLADMGFFLASNIILETKFPPENKLNALRAFNKLIVDTALGQVLDVTLPAVKGPKREEDVLAVEHYKTAQYTAVGPLSIGAHLAGGSPKLINSLALFGENLGIAFQIQDDIKGIFGKSEETGKSAKEDIAEGKITLLYVHALKNTKTKGQKNILGKFYGKANLAEEEAEKVRQVFRETGALDYAIAKSKEYSDRARLEIPKISKACFSPKLKISKAWSAKADLSKDKKIQELYTSLADFVLKAK